MTLIRTTVVVLILLAATPAFGQEKPEDRNRRLLPQVRTLVTNYSGIYGRFMYGRPLHVVRPRTLWVVDDYMPEGRPLGISGNYNYFDTEGRVYTDWNRWPYVSTGGRDEAPKETPKAEADAAMAEGRALWKAADYAGALAAFKKAVANDLKNAGARFHMALALLATGDLRNADKALASGLDLARGPEELPSLGADSFRNAKERAKFETKLFPMGDGTGSLTVALAQHLLGLKEKAAKTLEGIQEPAAAKLGVLIR